MEKQQTDDAATMARVPPPPTGSALYRSAVSGLWYENAVAAGDISAVICKHCRDGVEAKDTDRGLDMVHRVADFFSDHECMPNVEVTRGADRKGDLKQ